MSASAAAPLRTAQAPVTLKAVPGGLPLGAILAGIALLAAVLVGLLHLDTLPFTVCFFKLATGWPCATCGSTRALGRLFHGDVAGAFGMNPLAAAGMLALLPWAAGDLALLTRGRALALELGPGAARAARVAAVAAVVANWAYLVAAGR
jgi:Protein of unknown function (DUF2752)